MENRTPSSQAASHPQFPSLNASGSTATSMKQLSSFLLPLPYKKVRTAALHLPAYSTVSLPSS